MTLIQYLTEISIQSMMLIAAEMKEGKETSAIILEAQQLDGGSVDGRRYTARNFLEFRWAMSRVQYKACVGIVAEGKDEITGESVIVAEWHLNNNEVIQLHGVMPEGTLTGAQVKSCEPRTFDAWFAQVITARDNLN